MCDCACTVALCGAVVDVVDGVLVLGAGYGIGFSDPDLFIVVVSYPHRFAAMFTINRFRKCNVDIHWVKLLTVS
jgi:N-acetylglutamate synthase/N-acetylornithine aminotransferase